MGKFPFMGELMVCSICGKQQKSDPKVESNWRLIALDNVPYYVCPDHFPPDAVATTHDFKVAYQRVMRQILVKHNHRRGKGKR